MRTARLMDLVADFGEHDLLLAGCQENVLTVPYRDGGMVPSPSLLPHSPPPQRLGPPSAFRVAHDPRPNITCRHEGACANAGPCRVD